MDTSFVTSEIVSQPASWLRAAETAARSAAVLPQPGERVAVTGCGTSWFMAMAYAALRESAGLGETDAFACSEFPAGRTYDRLVVITRSGTTTEALNLLARAHGTTRSVAITADPATPVMDHADDAVVLDHADERSVVQTRFATSTLALLRASLGEDVTPLAADAQTALAQDLTDLTGADQMTFLGTGWTVGLAHEAALKMREAACAWTEAYPAMEYRHGPISIAQPRRVTWMFGTPPAGLADDVSATGATFVTDGLLDPMAHLILAQRVAVATALARGLDPDHPRNLTRSVVLDAV